MKVQLTLGTSERARAFIFVLLNVIAILLAISAIYVFGSAFNFLTETKSDLPPETAQAISEATRPGKIYFFSAQVFVALAGFALSAITFAVAHGMSLLDESARTLRDILRTLNAMPAAPNQPPTP